MTMTQFKTCVRRTGIIVCIAALVLVIFNVVSAYADTATPAPVTDPTTGQVIDPSVDTSIGATYDPSMVDYSTIGNYSYAQNNTYQIGTTYDPMANTLNSLGVNVSDTSDDFTPDALGNYRRGCDSHQRRWKAVEGSALTVGHVTMTAHRCWNGHGHLVDGTRITQEYDRSNSAILAGYNFSGQGTNDLYSDNGYYNIAAYGHAQLCIVLHVTGCGFNEQFEGGAFIYAPKSVDQSVGTLPKTGVVWNHPEPRYDPEKGYHLNFSRDDAS